MVVPLAQESGKICTGQIILQPISLCPTDCQTTWVVSSAVEHCLHTAGVTGSNPVPPTKLINDLRHLRVPTFICGVKIGRKSAFLTHTRSRQRSFSATGAGPPISTVLCWLWRIGNVTLDQALANIAAGADKTILEKPVPAGSTSVKVASRSIDFKIESP